MRLVILAVCALVTVASWARWPASAWGRCRLCRGRRMQEPLEEKTLSVKTKKKLDALMAELRTEHARIEALEAAYPQGPIDSAYKQGIPREEFAPQGELTVDFSNTDDT